MVTRIDSKTLSSTFIPSITATSADAVTGTANNVFMTPSMSKVLVNAMGGVGGGGASVTVANTAPVSGSTGDLWWDQDDALLKIYVNSAWANTSSGSAGGNVVSTTGTTGAAILPSGTLAQRPVSPSNGMIRYNSNTATIEAYANNIWANVLTSPGIVYPATNGEQSYTSPGTFSWTCPAGVLYVHVVCVGGGGGATGSSAAGCGGGGGGLAWRNDIPVTPGTSYTVVVGSGGIGGTTTGATAGGASYFANTSTVVAYGGGQGINNGSSSGGGYFPTGGNGGGSTQSSGTASSGGGGAGGYSGAGGAGNSTAGTAGAGGGGGGGGTGISGGYAGGVAHMQISRFSFVIIFGAFLF